MVLLNASILYANDAPAPSYHWGRGYHIPAANLTLGGYFNTSYRYLENSGSELTLDSLSLFISWQPFERIHLFSELELEEIFSLDGIRAFNESFRVERLYADVLVNEAWTVRIGQYLTPISRWNLLHAAPLVWTTSRPTITEGYVLANHGTGLEVLYSTSLLQRDFNLSVFADNSKNLQINYHEHSFIYAFGSRLNYQLFNSFNIGGSYVYSKTNNNYITNQQHTFGFDFLWQKKQYELQFESLFSFREASHNQYGLYLQAVAPVLDTLFVVGRYEYMYGGKGIHHFSLQRQNKSSHIGVIGLTWRPATPIAFKIEYRSGYNNQDIAPSGFLSSISMLF